MEQCWSSALSERIQGSRGVTVVGFLSDKDEAQFWRIDGSRANLSRRFSMAILRGRGTLARKITSQNGVYTAALQCGPPIGGIRNMEMEEWDSRDPDDQPGQNEKAAE